VGRPAVVAQVHDAAVAVGGGEVDPADRQQPRVGAVDDLPREQGGVRRGCGQQQRRQKRDQKAS
jgi:hypothetical protein